MGRQDIEISVCVYFLKDKRYHWSRGNL